MSILSDLGFFGSPFLLLLLELRFAGSVVFGNVMVSWFILDFVRLLLRFFFALLFLLYGSH